MKYKFEGLGGAQATIIMALLAANPSTLFLTQGILGRIVHFVLKKLGMYLANYGLIFINVGAAAVETMVDAGNYDDAWSDAEKAVKLIRDQGRKLTDEEIKAIDAPVIDAFRKFANFGRVRNTRNPGL